jgi:hypothetical protein
MAPDTSLAGVRTCYPSAWTQLLPISPDRTIHPSNFGLTQRVASGAACPSGQPVHSTDRFAHGLAGTGRREPCFVLGEIPLRKVGPMGLSRSNVSVGLPSRAVVA